MNENVIHLRRWGTKFFINVSKYLDNAWSPWYGNDADSFSGFVQGLIAQSVAALGANAFDYYQPQIFLLHITEEWMIDHVPPGNTIVAFLPVRYGISSKENYTKNCKNYLLISTNYREWTCRRRFAHALMAYYNY